MISLLRMEFAKILHQKTILSFFSLALCINLGVLYYHQYTETIPISAYNHIQKELTSIPNEERYEFIQHQYEQLQSLLVLQQLQNLQIDPEHNQDQIAFLFAQHPDIEQSDPKALLHPPAYASGSLEHEAALFTELKKEMDILHAYPKMLDDIQDKATAISGISLFSETESFSTRNLQKTANDYRNMTDVQPTYQLEKGIKDAVSFPFTNFLLLMIGFVIASSLILEEKQKGLLGIVRTTRWGDAHTMICKLITLVVTLSFMTILLYGSNLCLMGWLMELGNLDVPLISLASFSMCTLPISIREFLFLFLASKCLAVCCIAVFFLFVCVLTKRKISYYAGIVLCLGIEGFLYLTISETGPWQLLKQLNLFTFLQTTPLFAQYQNINLFNYPISLGQAAFCMLVSGICILSIATCISYTICQDLSLHAFTLFHRKQKKLWYAPSLFLQEAYKLLWMEKGIWILLCFFIIQCINHQNTHIFLSPEEQNWMQYMERIEGKNNQEIASFLSDQNDYFVELENQLASVDEQYQRHKITQSQYQQMKSPLEMRLLAKSTFDAIKERHAYSQEQPNRVLIAPFTYERIFLDDASFFPLAVLYLCIFLFCISDLYCIEYAKEEHVLITTTRVGRTRLFYHKMVLALCVSLLVLLITYIPKLTTLASAYGFPALTASITSLPQFSDLPVSLSLLNGCLLLFLFRFLASFVLLAVLCACSHLWKKQRTVFCIVSILILLPLFLSLIGFTFIDDISLKPLLCAGTYVNEGRLLVVCSSALVYSLGAVCLLRYSYHAFQKPK